MCDRFPRKFDVQTSYKPLNYVLELVFVVNLKFSRETYLTIVPSTGELYCLNRVLPWMNAITSTRGGHVVTKRYKKIFFVN